MFPVEIGDGKKEGQTNRKIYFEDSPEGSDCFISVLQRTITSKQIITFHFQPAGVSTSTRFYFWKQTNTFLVHRNAEIEFKSGC